MSLANIYLLSNNSDVLLDFLASRESNTIDTHVSLKSTSRGGSRKPIHFLLADEFHTCIEETPFPVSVCRRGRKHDNSKVLEICAHMTDRLLISPSNLSQAVLFSV